VDRAALEAAVARVFTGRMQIGQFDPEGAKLPWDALTSDVVFSKKHQQVALEGAQQSVVLLRNPPASLSQAAHLPLKRGLNVAVVGPNGNAADVFQGQYHGGNCPDAHPAAPFNPTYDYDCLPTAFTAISSANIGGNTSYHNGCSLSPSPSDGSGHPEGQPCASLMDIDAVLDAVKVADVVLLFLGLDIKMTNKEGQDRPHDWTGYALPGMQQELARRIALTNIPTVVVEVSGMATGMDFIAQQHNWPLVIAGYGGRFGPEALAGILFGDFSPTGRLPYTIYPEAWANNTEMTDMALTAGDGRTYKWYNGEAPIPFIFGEGMTYTTFNTTMTASGRNSFQVSVTNTGKIAAAQTLMLFARPVSVPEAPSPLPNRQLFDFARTHTLPPGGSETLHFAVDDSAVALVDWAGSRKVYAGSYEIEFFAGEKTPAATATFTVSNTVILSTIPSPRSIV